jgi:hypothetical protein
MIKVDLTRVVSPRFGLYLLGLIPGVFFESSIAIGNSHFVASVMGRLRDIYPFGPYALLLLFLASSLFIGSGFFLTAWIVQLIIPLGFKLWRYGIRGTFGSQWMYRWFGRLQGIPPKRNILIRSLSKLIFWARGRELFTDARPVLKCLHTATKQLLQQRYGIEMTRHLQLDNSEWQVWPSVIGKPVKSFQEAIVGARTFLGCGLAGFAALHAAPALRERYFVALCSVFAVTGLFVSFNLAFWTFDPVRRNIARLRSVLLELSETTEKRNAEVEGGPTATAGANDDGLP